MLLHSCRGQRTTCRNRFFPLSYWSRKNFWSSELAANSHPPHLPDILFFSKQVIRLYKLWLWGVDLIKFPKYGPIHKPGFYKLLGQKELYFVEKIKVFIIIWQREHIWEERMLTQEESVSEAAVEKWKAGVAKNPLQSRHWTTAMVTKMKKYVLKHQTIPRCLT